MKADSHETWMRLQSFRFDDSGADFQFTDRLARENGWSSSFAGKVVEEYRRFLFLAIVARHPVTPSDEVDQAWHLHLCYTRSYWDELCGKVLGRPLHHGPTKGGGSERRKFDDWYRQTLESYEEFFGEAPPPEIWPPSESRFRRANWTRVDRTRHLVLSKRVLAAVSAIGLLAVFLQGCTDAEGKAMFVLYGFWGLLIVVVAIAVANYRNGGGGGGKGGSGWFGGGCGGGFGCGGDSGCGGGGCGGGGCGGS